MSKRPALNPSEAYAVCPYCGAVRPYNRKQMLRQMYRQVSKDTFHVPCKYHRRQAMQQDDAMRSNLVDIDVYCKHRTEKAILVSLEEDGPTVWVPLSQCEYTGEVPGYGELTLPEYTATEKGLL